MLETNLLSAIDARCLKNKHTLELVNQEYFRQWMALKTKISLPCIWFWVALLLFKLITFCIFDLTFIWIENTLLASSGEICVVSPSNRSCIQDYYNNNECPYYLGLAYTSMGLLLILIVSKFIQDTAIGYSLYKSIIHITYTPLGKKEILVENIIYTLLDFVTNFSIIINMIVRVIRHTQGVYIPTYVDNISLYFTYFGLTWGFLFTVQLVPYVGYIATVIKLMMKDTLIFLLFIIMFAIPYWQLFPRIINDRTSINECNPDWKNQWTSLYSTHLLLFNMINFKDNTEDSVSTSETAQLYVSVTLQTHFIFQICKAKTGP